MTSTNPSSKPTLTKSQKKRMKRNAAKSRKEAAQQQQQQTQSNNNNNNTVFPPTTTTTTPKDSMINPNDVVRHNLVSMGYTLEEVNTALDEMWNLSLQYDEVDAVLTYLQERKARQEEEQQQQQQQQQLHNGSPDEEEEVQAVPISTQEEGEGGINSTTHSQKEEPDTDVSTAASATPVKSSEQQPSQPRIKQPTPSSTTNKPSNNGVHNHKPKNGSAARGGGGGGGGGTKPSSSLRNRTNAANGTTAGGAAGAATATATAAHPMADLGMKLDTVASAENLLDAISALTQWVTKAATVPEIQEFVSGKITTAPITVVKRTISPSSNINTVPQLLDLLCSILRRIGVPTSDLTTTAKALQSTIVQARATVLASSSSSSSSSDTTTTTTTTTSSTTTPGLDRTIALGIARNVVDGISETVHKLLRATKSSAKSVRVLQQEIEGMDAEAASGGNNANGNRNARDLMSTRDNSKIVAEKYSRILEITMQSRGVDTTTTTTTTATNGLNGRSSSTRNGTGSEGIMMSLLGERYETISNSKLEQETLQKRLSQATSSTINTRQRIVSNITAYVAERDQINSRIDELKLELHRLTVSQSTLTQKIDERKEELAKFDRSLTGEAREIESRLSETSKQVAVYENVKGVVENLENLSASLRKTMNNVTKTSVVQKAPVGKEKLQKHMEDYLMRMKRYFESEVKMVGFLRERAISLEHQVPSLELEIQECTALGMTSNVSEMTKNLRDMVQNVADDRGIADALRDEASKMRDDLMERTEQYMDMVRRGESNLLDTERHHHVMDLIRQNASLIELPNTSRYGALIDSIMAMSAPSATTPAAQSPPAPASVPVPAGSAAPAPIPTNAALAATTTDHGYENNPAENQEYSNNKIEIPGHVIVNGSIGGIVAAGSTVGQNVAAIEKIVAETASPAPLPIKAGWGRVNESKTTSRSLLDIQKEELSMK